MNEIRNELLTLLNLTKTNDKKFYTELLLERFEIDIKRQLEDIQYKEEQLKDNLETLKYVREELNKFEEENK